MSVALSIFFAIILLVAIGERLVLRFYCIMKSSCSKRTTSFLPIFSYCAGGFGAIRTIGD
jgi:hypothetical protein